MVSFRRCSSLLLAMLASYAAPASAQTYPSLTTIMSPRTEALGEATVAVPGSADPFLSNPAGLAVLTGAWATYGMRGDEPGLSHPGGFRMWEGGVSTAWGTFTLGYHSYDRDYLRYIWMMSVPVHRAEYTAGAAWGYPLTHGFHIGAGLKTFREAEAGSGPALLDAGLLLAISRGRRYKDYRNQVTLGLAVQNIGIGHYSRSVPGFAHLGLSLQLTPAATDSESAAPLKFLASAELMSTINKEYRDFSYAAVGVELTINEIVSLRLGLGAPSQSAGGGTTFRYGAGLRLPLPVFAGDRRVPLCIKADYAAAPVFRTVVVTAEPGFDPFSLDAAAGSGTIHLFTIGLAYEGEIFPR